MAQTKEKKQWEGPRPFTIACVFICLPALVFGFALLFMQLITFPEYVPVTAQVLTRELLPETVASAPNRLDASDPPPQTATYQYQMAFMLDGEEHIITIERKSLYAPGSTLELLINRDDYSKYNALGSFGGRQRIFWVCIGSLALGIVPPLLLLWRHILRRRREKAK